MENNNAFSASEKFSKFLIKIIYYQKEYYTLAGADLTTFNKEDKLLIDVDNNFLLFENIEQLLGFIEMSDTLFDVENIISWSKSEDAKPTAIQYQTVNIDILKLDDFDILNEEQINKVKSIVDHIYWYSEQVNNNILKNILSSEAIETIDDTYMNTYIWSGVEPKEISADLQSQFVPKLNELYSEFIKCIRIYKIT